MSFVIQGRIGSNDTYLGRTLRTLRNHTCRSSATVIPLLPQGLLLLVLPILRLLPPSLTCLCFDYDILLLLLLFLLPLLLPV